MGKFYRRVAAGLAASFLVAEAAVARDISLPFELDNKVIFLQAKVAGRSTWVILDTGDKYTVVDMDLARAAGLPLGQPVEVGGGGDHTVTGAMAQGGGIDVAGVSGQPLPVFIAVPLGDIARASGHEVGGIIGYDFLSRYVVEINYRRRRLVLHEPAYRYAGHGQTLPITFNSAGHPQVRAEVIDRGRELGEGLYTLDIGSAVAIVLNAPFVNAHQLLDENRPTVAFLGGAGVGGTVQGRIGRVTGFKLGHFLINDPIVMFATSAGGAFAGSDAQGNIGAAILERFKLIIDYPRRQVSFEPSHALSAPLDYDKTGIVWTSSGPTFDTFTVKAVAPGSPAEAAQIRPGDHLVAIDGRAASKFRLSDVRELLQKSRTFTLLFERSGSSVTIRLKPRRRV
ncbi:MAG TPA: aspartyl protease family protein [Parvularculaceae bacterium]|nr:aspartyl protease family protein [Parvularculaceae bacterium]